MSKISRRSLQGAVAVPAVAAVLFIGGCNSEDRPNGTAPEAVASTSSTPASPTTTATPKATYLTAGNFGPALKQSTAKHTTVKMTARMVVGGKTGTMTGLTRMTKPVGMDITMQGEPFGGNGRMILVGKTLYFSMAGATPPGKFVKFDLTDSEDPNAAQLARLLDSADPGKAFDSVRTGLTDVRHVGTETVDGVKTERYAVTVDVAKVLQAQGQPVPSGMPKTTTYTIWMDGQNLPRRLTFNLAGVSMVMTMSDWGKPVAIKAPAASQVVSR